MHSASRILHPTSWQRAGLVRTFVELLASQAPIVDVWPMCCRELALLMRASHVAIAVRTAAGDRIVCRLIDGVASVPSEAVLAADSLLYGVFASDATMRTDDAAFGRSSIAVPIRFGATLLGAICVEGAAPPDGELVTLLESCALSAGSRLNTDAMIDNTDRYERLAFTDALTGIANRRRFDETFTVEWSRAARSGLPLTMLMMDVDHFKIFNDTYGHPAGDACLQQVAHAIKDGIGRASDLFARYGGEEFVALLPGIDVASGIRLAEGLKGNVDRLHIAHCGSSLERVSLSIGVASLVPNFEIKPDTLLFAADAALYEAKHAGRNRVYAAGHTSGVAPEPALVRRRVPQNNLPPQHTRLIGRIAELRDIAQLLEHEPLVTLTACGGAGKTRTSIAVAGEIAADFPDGTWFADLAGVSDSGAIAATIGAFFSLDIPPGVEGRHVLARALAHRSTLLVFDNCEHVVGEVAAIAAALVSTAGGVRILATSREPLGICGETVYRLPLLAVPSAALPLDVGRAAEYDAVALFVERARAVKRDFRMTADNVGAIAAICRQLDGIPLAIELAAARVGVISVGEISERVGERFRLLRGGHRAGSPRQQTLRALIDWSYDLLSAREQLIFRRLSVFAGGWTLAAMTAVCAGRDIDADDVLDVLAGLVRKSLVVDTIDDTASRYRLLESVREYAREKCRAASDSGDLERRHAVYYFDVATAAKATHYTTPSREWLLALEPEADNFRSALHWSLSGANDVALGAALAGALVPFLLQVSPNETLRWTRKALALLPPDTQPAIEAALWYGVGRSGESLPAGELRTAAERAVSLARRVGDPQLLAESLRQLILVQGWYYPAELAATRALAHEGIHRALDIGEPVAIALALRSLSVTIDNDDVEAKVAILEESLSLLVAHGNDLQTAIALMWLAEYDFCFGGAAKALTYARKARRLAEQSGSASMLAQMNANLAQYAAGQADWDAARRAAVDAAYAAAALGMDDQVTWAVGALAVVTAGTGDYSTAARLAGFCDGRAGRLHSQRQANGAEDVLYGRLFATLQAHLSPATLEAALASGAGLDLSAALEAAQTAPLFDAALHCPDFVRDR